MVFPGGWNYYKEYEQPGSNDGELINYQVNITVEHITDKMRDDYGDIRFTLNDNTEIPYHLVNYTEAEAHFVVKIPSIPTTGITLRMWYGNPSATTTSNPKNVYNAYITGENDETNLFTLVDIKNSGMNASFTYNSVNHHYSLKTTYNDFIFAKINSLDNKANLKLKANIYRYSNTGNDQGGLIARQKASGTWIGGRYDNFRLYMTQYLNGTQVDKDSDSYNFPRYQWFTVELVVIGNSADVYWYDSNGVLVHSESTSTLDASIDSGSWGLLAGYNTNSEAWFKNIVACEVTSNPPGDGVWGDEIRIAPDVISSDYSINIFKQSSINDTRQPINEYVSSEPIIIISNPRTVIDNILIQNNFSLIDSRTVIDNILIQNNFSLIDPRTIIDNTLIWNNFLLSDSRTAVDSILYAYYFHLLILE